MQNQSKHNITFDTQLKTALKQSQQEQKKQKNKMKQSEIEANTGN